MPESLTIKVLTVLAGALAGGLVGVLSTSFQDWRKRKGLHKRLGLYEVEQYQDKATLRVHNGYVLPMTKCSAYITLEYEELHIVDPPNGWAAHIKPQLPIRFNDDRLCWSSHSPVQNPAELNIYAGEHQSLEVMSFDPKGKWIGIFSEARHNPYRVFLRGDKPYKGTIKIVSKETEAKTFSVSIDLTNKKFPLRVINFSNGSIPLRLLRLFLAFSAFVWGVCIVGVFASWPQVNSIAQGMGAKPIAYDPMLDYWLRMICGAFMLVGVWYLVMALWPRKFAVAIPWFGWLMIVEGVILLVSGLRLGIGPFPFYGDVTACFLLGAGIVFFAKAARS